MGDIIAFVFPDDRREILTKRIVGTPGDRLKVVGGSLVVNDVVVKEPYVEEQYNFSLPEIVVPKDCYFVMGDNRDDSWDSRFWENTFVRREDILARAVFSWFPKFKWLW
jgi:signal peptidase I